MEMIRATMDEKKFSSHNFSNAAEIIFFIIFGLGCFVMEAKIDLVICRNQRQARKTAKKNGKKVSLFIIKFICLFCFITQSTLLTKFFGEPSESLIDHDQISQRRRLNAMPLDLFI